MGGAGFQLVSNRFRLGDSSQMPGWLLEMVTISVDNKCPKLDILETVQ